MTAWIYRLLRFPPLPEAGPGEELLRPSPKQFALDVARWGLKQLGALFGILISIAFLRGAEVPFVDLDRETRRAEEIEARLRQELPEPVRGFDFEMIVWGLEGLAIASFLVQLTLSGALLRLNFRSRVYVIGDEKVRLREGLLTVNEQTFSVANIQNLVVRQGPIQHLLGIANLEISTAGGGAGATTEDPSGERHDLHTGRLRSLDDAGRVRDRLRQALERHRHAGLGDSPDLRRPASTAADPTPSHDLLLEAATALRDETRALRSTLL